VVVVRERLLLELLVLGLLDCCPLGVSAVLLVAVVVVEFDGVEVDGDEVDGDEVDGDELGLGPVFGDSLIPLLEVDGDDAVAPVFGTFAVLTGFPSLSKHPVALQYPPLTYCSVKGAACCGAVAVVGDDAVGVVAGAPVEPGTEEAPELVGELDLNMTLGVVLAAGGTEELPELVAELPIAGAPAFGAFSGGIGVVARGKSAALGGGADTVALGGGEAEGS